MKNKKYVTFQVRRSILRGMLYFIIFVSMVDHAVTLIYDPDGRVERIKKRSIAQAAVATQSAKNACETPFPLKR